MGRFGETTWAGIDGLRGQIQTCATAGTVQEAAQAFTALMSARFETLVLARLFVVLPFERLPVADQAAATALVNGDARLTATTRVLSLLGTTGRQPRWNDRTLSEGHRAIPLLDQQFVQGIPMIARLLGDLEIDLASLADGRPIATRRMLGGSNSTFFVDRASSAKDAQGRFVIPSQKFVKDHAIETVFGMGGSWFDGTLAVAIFFCAETIERLVVDRFPSLISNFKMATSKLIQGRHLYSGSGAR